MTRHIWGHRAVPGVSGAAEVKALLGSCSCIKAMSEELVQALRGQLGMAQTALTQGVVGHARVVTSLGKNGDNETLSCPLR